MQPVAPSVGFPPQAAPAPASAMAQPGAAPATPPVFAGKTPAINFGCTTDQVQFGSAVKDVKFGDGAEETNADSESKPESKEDKPGFMKKTGRAFNRYIGPISTLGAGAFIFIAPAPLHMIPVLGTLAATPLHIIGAGVALAGVGWFVLAHKWLGKKDKANADDAPAQTDGVKNGELEEPRDPVNPLDSDGGVHDGSTGDSDD